MKKSILFIATIFLCTLFSPAITFASNDEIRVYNDTDKEQLIWYTTGCNMYRCDQKKITRIPPKGTVILNNPSFSSKVDHFMETSSTSCEKKNIAVVGYSKRKVHSGEQLNISTLLDATQGRQIPGDYTVILNNTDSSQVLHYCYQSGYTYHSKDISLQPGELIPVGYYNKGEIQLEGYPRKQMKQGLLETSSLLCQQKCPA